MLFYSEMHCNALLFPRSAFELFAVDGDAHSTFAQLEEEQGQLDHFAMAMMKMNMIG